MPFMKPSYLSATIAIAASACLSQTPTPNSDPGRLVAEVSTSPETVRDTGIVALRAYAVDEGVIARGVDADGRQIAEMSMDWARDDAEAIATIHIATTVGGSQTSVLLAADGTTLESDFGHAPASFGQLTRDLSRDLRGYDKASSLSASCGAALIAMIGGGFACGGTLGVGCAIAVGGLVKALDAC